MFFISTAYAQTAPAATGSDPGSLLTGLLPMILIFIVFWFLLIRPQMKKQKEHKTMVEALGKGDEVVTAGGLVGRITELQDQYLTLQIASVGDKPIEVSVQRGAVTMLLPKGTMKSL